MKKQILAVSLSLLFGVVYGQQNASDYLVKTKNAKKAEASLSADTLSGQKAEEEKVYDFISENFRYYSLCDWKEGMKFMVLPEKYDLVVKTFHDPTLNGKEVSSMTLRHKIMVYKGHTTSADGHAHINFTCEDTGKDYYFEVPNGTFDDYCYTKFGVPTLAYLGDVDIAREKLIGKTLFTRATQYYIDTDYDSDGCQEISVAPNEVVTVTAVGVGTRSYPVKIIVEDKNGKEFFQNVAISKTNSGMRDEEFVMDNNKHLFSGSFELQDAIMAVSSNLAKYIGQTVHNKYATDMLSRGDGKERTLKVPRLTTFTIENIAPQRNSPYVTLTLKEFESRRIYFKDVTFQNGANVTGEVNSQREDYFGYLFAMGEGKARTTSQAARAAIRQGRVILNMSEDEVILAMGEPDQTTEGRYGHHDWIYNRSGGKLLIVEFDGSGKVLGTNIDRTNAKSTTTKKKRATTKKSTTAKKKK